MTSTIMMFLPLLTLITISTAVIQRKHLLMALLALEATILSLVIVVVATHSAQWAMIILVMFTFGACGASLGLACMVAMSRTYGNDHIAALSINKC